MGDFWQKIKKFWRTVKDLPAEIKTMIETRPQKPRSSRSTISTTKKKKGAGKFPWWIPIVIGILGVIWYFQPDSQTLPAQVASQPQDVVEEAVSFWWIPVIAALILILLGIAALVVFYRPKLGSWRMGRVFRSKWIWSFVAAVILLTATWIVLGDFFPTVWGVANEQLGAKYLIAIPLAVVALVILYFALAKKGTTTGSTPAAKASGRIFDWQAPFRTAILIALVIVAIVAVLNYASEGGHSGLVAWTDGSTATGWEATKDGAKPPPVTREAKLVVTAQIGLLDGLVHSTKRSIDAFFTDTLGIVTHTEPTTLQKTVTVSCASGTCSFCFTSNLPRPQEGGDWRVRTRDQNGNSVYAYPPYRQTQWHPLPQPNTTFDFRGNQGVLYVYGGQKSGTCVP